jgi:hypothetical protein
MCVRLCVEEMLEMLVNDQQFSRPDWRPGKRRKRVKRVHNWGGAKVANAAFLEAGKATWFKPGREGARLCKALNGPDKRRRRCAQGKAAKGGSTG